MTSLRPPYITTVDLACCSSCCPSFLFSLRFACISSVRLETLTRIGRIYRLSKDGDTRPATHVDIRHANLASSMGQDWQVLHRLLLHMDDSSSLWHDILRGEPQEPNPQDPWTATLLWCHYFTSLVLDPGADYISHRTVNTCYPRLRYSIFLHGDLLPAWYCALSRF